ncbi:RMD1 family protein [Reichenbachiella carrageenanivorans]|uniref:RMD1 family protein n=1 Tax=Reichenbachiella carrageenanivorans TaxID=2979869 RepID=A0ABY6CUS9_9BACT|nr:RMD1 family protein [Reichenbachiella carrageenanivorans]UXX77677.1 RMD1 family protein [Reichenbachiella carrageenanivorans]
MSDLINTLKAFHMHSPINLKACRVAVEEDLIESNSLELFFGLGTNKYGLIFSYGVLVFYNCGQQEIDALYTKLGLTIAEKDSDLYQDDFGIKQSAGDYQTRFDHIALPEINEAVIRIAMLNLGQSLALKYYDTVSQDLLTSVREFTAQLESNGQLKIGRKSILRFVGKALNTQNRIAENLYIFDAPPATWESEYLEKVNLSLSKHFDLSTRYRSIDSTFKIIKDNLSTYMDLYHHKESSRLEWIIIILILVEVLDTFISKLL